MKAPWWIMTHAQAQLSTANWLHRYAGSRGNAGGHKNSSKKSRCPNIKPPKRACVTTHTHRRARARGSSNEEIKINACAQPDLSPSAPSRTPGQSIWSDGQNSLTTRYVDGERWGLKSRNMLLLNFFTAIARRQRLTPKKGKNRRSNLRLQVAEKLKMAVQTLSLHNMRLSSRELAEQMLAKKGCNET